PAKQRPAEIAAPKRTARSRREMLIMARNGAILVGVLGGGGYFATRSVMASIAEHDLDRIGNGTPAVVQIHDPDCPVCRRLQTATRDAMGGIEDGALTYLVANIKTDEGRALAARHGVGNITILLFDGDGRMRRVLRGERSSEMLQTAFERHVQETAAGG
ncbi:MAG: thioredoxin family protein, partial [Pseudomonadota bacterium]